MADYRVGTNGTSVSVTILTARASKRTGKSAGLKGWSVIFRSTCDLTKFVQARESEGYMFEGKNVLSQRG